MENTKIDWCDSSWNPVTGCLHGCEYCYARRITERFGRKAIHQSIEVLDNPYTLNNKKQPYPFGFNPTFHRYRLNDYIGKKSRNNFVCSMADLFGEWVPDSWIKEVFVACEKAPQHNYLFLTKNPERYFELAEYYGELPEKDNFWYGSTASTRNDQFFCGVMSRHHTFLSIEPILGDFGDLRALKLPEWIIIGAETGNRKNKVIPRREWIGNIVNQCRDRDIPVFMKSSLADIWEEPLIQEFPAQLQKGGRNEVRS